MASATNTQLGEIQLAGDLAGNGGAQVGTNPQLKTIPGLVPGSYSIPNITVDAKGRITSITNGGADLLRLIPAATATRAGVVSIGDNLYVAGEADAGYWKVGYNGQLTLLSPTGLVDQSCAQYSFNVSVDNGSVQTVTIYGAQAPTIETLIVQVNQHLQGAVLGLLNGDLAIVSTTEGNTSSVVLSEAGLFACINGFVDVGAETPGNGSCEIYAKRGSKLDYGVIKVGSGLEVEDGVVSFNAENLPLANTTTLGVVSVPEAGNIDVDVSGAISIPAATASTPGVVQIGSGLKMTGSSLSVDAATLPNATASTKGVVQVGTGLLVSNGVISVDGAAIVIPDATTSSKGVVRVGSGLAVTAGVISAPVATDSTTGVAQIGAGLSVSSGVISVATASQSTLGAVKGGTGITVAGDGTISADVLPDASTTEKGLVQLTSGDALQATGGVASIRLASATQTGVAKIGTGLNVAAGVISIGLATTSAPGAVRIGSGITVSSGVISAAAIPTASSVTLGVVQIDTTAGLQINSGTLLAATASASNKGVVQIGSGLTISSGIVSQAVSDGFNAGGVKLSNLTDLSISSGVLSIGPNIARKDVPNTFNAAISYGQFISTAVNVIALDNTHNYYEIPFNSSSTTPAIVSQSAMASGTPMVVSISWQSNAVSISFPPTWSIRGYTAPTGAGSAVIEGFWTTGGSFVGKFTKVTG